MRKEDLTTASLMLEAVTLIFAVVYMGLQIFYGIVYHVSAYKFICNLLCMILIYTGLTLMSNHPENLNRIPVESCVGDIRKYSLRLIRLVKFIFVTGLLIPCVFDVMGISILSSYSLIIIGLLLLITVYYEYKIINLLKQ